MTPLARDRRIENVKQAVDGEEPHKQEVPCHPLRQPVTDGERVVEPGWEELDQRRVTPAYAIDVVRPIDQKPAPDHHHQYREVDPVEPAYRQRMFFLETFHDCLAQIQFL